MSNRSRGATGSRQTPAQARSTQARSLIKVAPPYQKPENPLTETAQRKLDALYRKTAQKETKAHFKKAADMVAESCYDIKSEQGRDATSSSAARARRERDHWRKFVDHADKLVSNAEDKVRKACDGQERHEWVVEGIRGANGPVGTGTSNTQMSSFNATLPGATSGSQMHPGATQHYKMIVQHKKDIYTSKSLYSRYADHEDYVNFKTSLHDGYYGEDAPEQMPKKSTWFENEEPAPGTTRDGVGSDSDSDLEVARVRISTKCPITLKEFEEPVTTTSCMHSFERGAILEMLGSRTSVQCPVPGCPNYITKAQLRPDNKLVRRIRRLQEAQRRQVFSEAEREAQGRGMDDSIMLFSDAPDAEGFVRLDDGGGRGVKEEMISQRVQSQAVNRGVSGAASGREGLMGQPTRQPPRSSVVTIELDTDSDDYDD